MIAYEEEDRIGEMMLNYATSRVRLVEDEENESQNTLHSLR